MEASSASSRSSGIGNNYDDEKQPVHQYNREDLEVLAKLDHFTNGGFSEEDLEIIGAHLNDRTIEESRAVLEKALKEHDRDPNVDVTYYSHLKALYEGVPSSMTEDEYSLIIRFEAFLIDDWSIYPEVRAVTRPIDENDGDDYETFRVYFLAIMWSCAGSTLATFFAVRFPSISLSSTALQLMIVYSGKLLALFPGFSIPLGFGKRWTNTHKPWSFKEQQLATIGMGVGNAAPYAQYAIIAMSNKFFYGFSETSSFGFIIILTLSSNTMGFGLAGLFRIFLVYPTRALWFNVLPQIKLSRSLVQERIRDPRQNVYGWKLKGWEWFALVTVVQFGWYWITDFVFQFLGYFNWLAFAAPDNINLNAICGVQTGLGLNPIPTLDPSIFQPTPLVSPFYSTVLLLFGMFISMFAIIIMWWTNVRWTAYIPINTNQLYDRFGKEFDVHKVLDSKNNLDEAKYQEYSLPFWSAGNIVNYGSFFALYPAMIVYMLLEYYNILSDSCRIFYKTILHPKEVLQSYDDRFMRAQRRYKEVPEWWYLFALVVCIALGIATVEHYKVTNTPVWTIFFAVGLSAVFMVPSGLLYAITNQQIIINVLYELIIGLAIPGNGTALMIAKTYATNFMAETDTYIGNLKLAHYTGIAPRSVFRVQIISMICNSFVQAGLMSWQASGGIPDLCDPKNVATNKFTCEDTRTYFNAAVQWGTIGPRRVLKKLYPTMRYCFLIGAVYPIPFWLVRRFLVPYLKKRVNPNQPKWKYQILTFEWLFNFNEVVVLVGCMQWAPYNLMYFIPWLGIGWFFQVFIRKRYPRWWAKYNYLTYAGITTGYSYSALIMFFATSYHHIASVNWWGNDTGMQRPIDAAGFPLLQLPEKGYFGLEPGTFP